MRSYLKEYFIDWSEWAPQDFGKPNLEKSHSLSTSVLLRSRRNSQIFARYKESFLRVGENETTLVVVMEFDKIFHTLYGTPESIYAIYKTSNESHSIFFDTIVRQSSSLQPKLLNKTATRIPESMFTTFNVVPDPDDTDRSGWKMNKLGESLQINKLDMQKTRGNAHQHGVLDGFSYSFGQHELVVRSLDAGIVVVGKPTGFPCPFDRPDLENGVSTMLVNNLWGVNYVMWYPFEKEDANILFRYVIESY